MRVNQEVLEGPRFSVLSEDQIEAIYEAALEILRRTGALVHHPEARELFREAGARVVHGRVFVPEGLVRAALASAPERVVLAGRERGAGARVLRLEKNRIHYGTGSDCPFVLDPRTGERRRATFEDVRDAARVNDALDGTDFHMSHGLTSDVPIGTYDRHQFLAMTLGTSKPLIVTAVDPAGLADQYAMGCAAVGGEEEFRHTPYFAVYIEPSSPLDHSAEALGKLLYAVEKRIPAIYTPCPMCGATGPATLAGVMAQNLAETLTGIVLAQIKQPGAPVIMGGVVSIMDMTSTVLAYGAPELALMSAGMAEIARWLRLPVFSTAGCSDSKSLDTQAAAEAALSIAIAGLSGANLIHDVGYLESGLLGSLDMLVLSDEIIGMVRHVLAGIAVDDEHLALDVVARVGPGGHFLADDHTYTHFREFWSPRLFDRRNWADWSAAGGRRQATRVRARVLELLETHRPAALPEAIETELRRIVAAADAAHRGEESVRLVAST
jgi:trimethylamine--corrinoid protein Co-methyltransferase